MSLGAYKKQSFSGGWTRVEMLVQIYNRAIASLEGCAEAEASDDTPSKTQHLLAAQKAIVALHVGLRPEEDEVAFNVARLLHFVVVSVGDSDYETAIRILQGLRDSFVAITEEANELEREGSIPPIPMADSFQSTA